MALECMVQVEERGLHFVKDLQHLDTGRLVHVIGSNQFITLCTQSVEWTVASAIYLVATSSEARFIHNMAIASHIFIDTFTGLIVFVVFAVFSIDTFDHGCSLSVAIIHSVLITYSQHTDTQYNATMDILIKISKRSATHRWMEVYNSNIIKVILERIHVNSDDYYHTVAFVHGYFLSLGIQLNDVEFIVGAFEEGGGPHIFMIDFDKVSIIQPVQSIAAYGKYAHSTIKTSNELFR